MIPFGSWAPDTYDLNGPQAGEALGVLPGRGSYHPWPKMSAFSAALAAYGRGVYLARSAEGSYSVFAGTATGLYKFASATTWTDVSGTTYGLPSDRRWSMAQFGSKLVAVNGVDGDAPQVVDIDSGSVFANLGGSPPKAAIAKSVGDFMFFGNTENYPTGVEWSGLNDIAYWTHGIHSSGEQQFPEGGFVTGITSLETGLIFQETAVRRFAQTGDQSIFAFARVEDAQGCIAQDSIVTLKGTSYYLGRSGFAKIGGETGFASIPLGLEITDKWFLDTINLTRLSTVQGAADPLRPRIFWLAPSSSNDTDLFDILLCYDIVLNQFTHATVSASMIFGGATPGYSLEGLDAIYPDLDAMAVSLDSPSLQGGIPYLAAFDASKKMAFFNGTNMAATVRTGEFQAVPGKRALITGFRPVGDATNIQGRLATRETLQASASWGSNGSPNAQGMIEARSSGRYHRAELSIAEDETWTHLQGVDFDPGTVMQDGDR